jgi:hypothetical protein
MRTAPLDRRTRKPRLEPLCAANRSSTPNSFRTRAAVRPEHQACYDLAQFCGAFVNCRVDASLIERQSRDDTATYFIFPKRRPRIILTRM